MKAETQESPGSPTPTASDDMVKLIQQYGCGPIPFTGTDNAFYERHLVFDNVIELMAAGPRERFEAVARSMRDILSQRWVHTETTYQRENPKRVYYLSMEFLIGRSLANNVTNLLLDPVAKRAVQQKNLDWFELLEQEPDAGLGNGGLGRLAACFLDSMATMQIPAMGYGLRYEYGIFKQSIRDGWQHELPDNWLRRPDPWEVPRPHETVDIKLNCSFEVRGGTLRAVVGCPSSSDRCAVRSPGGGLRRQDHQYPPALGCGGARLLQLSGIQQRRFRRRAGRDARGRIADAGTCIPTTPRARDRDCASCRNIFSSPALWPISCGASGRATPTGMRSPRKLPSSSTIRTQRWRSPS